MKACEAAPPVEVEALVCGKMVLMACEAAPLVEVEPLGGEGWVWIACEAMALKGGRDGGSYTPLIAPSLLNFASWV